MNFSPFNFSSVETAGILSQTGLGNSPISSSMIHLLLILFGESYSRLFVYHSIQKLTDVHMQRQKNNYC